jgi:hypothetical protein
MNPALADMLGTLDNRERAEVKDALNAGIGLAGKEQPKRKLTAEHKAAMKAGREAKARRRPSA